MFQPTQAYEERMTRQVYRLANERQPMVLIRQCPAIIEAVQSSFNAD
jgi:hypothetical protein